MTQDAGFQDSFLPFHEGQCHFQAKEEYMACLREQGHQAESCRSLAKQYLECRMER